MYRIHGANHSNWARANTQQLSDEVTWFRRRWEEVSNVLGVPVPFDGKSGPAYVHERELMIGALVGRPDVRVVARMIVCLAKSHLPASHKVFLAMWAVGLLVPLSAWRARAVQQRRSPADRPRWLRSAVRVLRGFQR
jgi:hypothetical protein